MHLLFIAILMAIVTIISTDEPVNNGAPDLKKNIQVEPMGLNKQSKLLVQHDGADWKVKKP